MKLFVCLSYALALAFVLLLLAPGARGEEGGAALIQRKTCLAADGVTVVYSVAGAGETALLFIHGGLADRSFFIRQLNAFADRYRVVAVDLVGHGESGANRKKWGLPEFGADVKTVVDAENLKQVILFGNSLGGPVAIEAALLLPGRAIGVVGIDTFQILDYTLSAEEARQRAEAFRTDFAGSMKGMVRDLFHPDADPALVAETEKRMLKTSPAAAYDLFMGMAGYAQAPSARKLTVPLRAINGDLFPTDVQASRKVKADFGAIIMKHTGHYPMIERPAEFNRHVAGIVEELAKRK
jgi:pimeloyl-ACP methyl ester carboxylesterase